MLVDITLDPIGRQFIPTVLKDQRFRSRGYLTGDSSVGYYWVVVDPRRHPLYVWRKRYSIHVFDADHYQRTALWLDAAAFSNGSMMEYPSLVDLGKLLAKKIGIWTLIAVLGAATVAAILSGGLAFPILAAALGALAGGILAGAIRAFMEWARGGRPYGFVKGDKDWVDDPGMGYNGSLV